MPKTKAKAKRKTPPQRPARRKKSKSDEEESDPDMEGDGAQEERGQVNDDSISDDEGADKPEDKPSDESEEEEEGRGGDERYDWRNFENMKRIQEESRVIRKAMVRGAVNKVVWTKLKFIVMPEKQLEFGGNVAKVVLEDLEIVPRDQRRFWEQNKDQVIGALSKKRNNICKDLKTKLMKEVQNGK